MKIIKKFLLAVIFLYFSPQILSSQTTKIISYNIKYDNQWDTKNNWQDRKEKITTLLNNNNPAILGIQEGLINQVKYIDSSLIHHKYFGIGRDGAEKGEFSAIFYDTLKYKLIEKNTFWLTETPDTISKGWDAALNRICTYGLLENISSKEKIWVFNTHFDHIGAVAREHSAKLLSLKINLINIHNYPIVLMGDFNLTPEEKPIHILKENLDDALEISETLLIGPKGTFNGFNLEKVTKKIDYFFTKNLKVLSYIHIDDLLNNKKHISDHLPIMIILKD